MSELGDQIGRFIISSAEWSWEPRLLITFAGTALILGLYRLLIYGRPGCDGLCQPK